mgnify:CR=1 FL=1
MSNKTPGEPVKKTASAPKRRSLQEWVLLAVLALLVVVTLGALGYMITSRGGPGCIQVIDNSDFDDVADSPKRISGPNYECLSLERVSEPDDLAKGLSGRESMPANQGMLFVFPESSKHCFWMKDMQFPLDMIWVDANKKVVHVEADVQPDSYPNEICPPQPAVYVIEVNAGVAKKAYLTPGSQLQF